MKRDYIVMGCRDKARSKTATSRMRRSRPRDASRKTTVTVSFINLPCGHYTSGGEQRFASPVRYTFASAPDRGDGAIMQKLCTVVKQYVVKIFKHYIFCVTGDFTTSESPVLPMAERLAH